MLGRIACDCGGEACDCGGERAISVGRHAIVMGIVRLWWGTWYGGGEGARLWCGECDFGGEACDFGGEACDWGRELAIVVGSV